MLSRQISHSLCYLTYSLVCFTQLILCMTDSYFRKNIHKRLIISGIKGSGYIGTIVMELSGDSVQGNVPVIYLHIFNNVFNIRSRPACPVLIQDNLIRMPPKRRG